MSRRVDEEQTAVDPCVLDELFPHGRQLLAEVGRVLVLDLEGWRGQCTRSR